MRISDWSSDVCSSDLFEAMGLRVDEFAIDEAKIKDHPGYSPSIVSYEDRKSVVSGKSVSVRVDLGGRRIIKKKNLESLSVQRPSYRQNNVKRDIMFRPVNVTTTRQLIITYKH